MSGPKTSAISRRRAIIVSAGAIGIGATGTILTDTTEASSIRLGDFQIDDLEHYGGVETVEVDITINAEWSGGDTLEMNLSTGDGFDRLTEIETKTIDIDGEGEQNINLNASVLESAYLSTGDFDLLVGQDTKPVEMYFELGATLKGGGSVLATDTLQESARITVNEGNADLEIGAVGDLSVN